MKNPFIYGEAVTGHDFCDRKAEIAKLTKDLLDSQKVFLIASRRIGKTSLLKSAMQEIQEREDPGPWPRARDFLLVYQTVSIIANP